MLKKALLALGLLMALFTGSVAAAEIPVISTTGVDLRAGPGVKFPVVDRLPGDARLVLHGCVTGYTWCDVSWRGDRGWVPAATVRAIDRNVPLAITAEAATRPGIAIVAFDAGYWHRYYVGRPWFRRWRAYRVW